MANLWPDNQSNWCAGNVASSVATYGFIFFLQPISMAMLPEFPQTKVGVRLLSWSNKAVMLGGSSSSPIRTESPPARSAYAVGPCESGGLQYISCLAGLCAFLGPCIGVNRQAGWPKTGRNHFNMEGLFGTMWSNL